MGFSLGLVYGSTWLVVNVAPEAGGAGVSEVMAYLNGVFIPKVCVGVLCCGALGGRGGGVQCGLVCVVRWYVRSDGLPERRLHAQGICCAALCSAGAWRSVWTVWVGLCG